MKHLAVTLVSALALISCASKKSATLGAKDTDKPLVQNVVRKDIGRITDCYHTELKRTPQLHGLMVVHYEVNDRGNVQSAKIKSSELKNKNMEACVVDIIKKESYPPAPSNTIAVIDYPLVFSEAKKSTVK